ncbi:MAG: hypothetical protein ACI9WL_000313 [Rubritalea sp.]|jgi:hypothetical protein
MKNTLLFLSLFLSVFTSLAQDLAGISFPSLAPMEIEKQSWQSPLVKEKNAIYYSPVTRKYSYNNRTGLGGDATFFNIVSDDVKVSQGAGWSVNFETRGNFRDDFDLIYSLGVFNHNFSVNEHLTNDQIDMSMVGVELKFLLAWKILQSDYFSIEAGPALQLNGELKIGNEEQYQDSFTGELDPVALKEFQNTMPLNLNGIIGFSGGVRNFRVTVHYHYSFIESLTGTNLAGDDIDGNFSFFSLGGRIYF